MTKRTIPAVVVTVCLAVGTAQSGTARGGNPMPNCGPASVYAGQLIQRVLDETRKTVTLPLIAFCRNMYVPNAYAVTVPAPKETSRIRSAITRCSWRSGSWLRCMDPQTIPIRFRGCRPCIRGLPKGEGTQVLWPHPLWLRRVRLLTIFDQVSRW